jgi:hypothetical protein
VHSGNHLQEFNLSYERNESELVKKQLVAENVHSEIDCEDAKLQMQQFVFKSNTDSLFALVMSSPLTFKTENDILFKESICISGKQVCVCFK